MIFQDLGDEQTKSKQEINELKESLRKEEGLRQKLASELEKKSEVWIILQLSKLTNCTVRYFFGIKTLTENGKIAAVF